MSYITSSAVPLTNPLAKTFQPAEPSPVNVTLESTPGTHLSNSGSHEFDMNVFSPSDIDMGLGISESGFDPETNEDNDEANGHLNQDVPWDVPDMQDVNPLLPSSSKVKIEKAAGVVIEDDWSASMEAGGGSSRRDFANGTSGRTAPKKKWTKDEDKRLRVLVEMHGDDWTLITKLLNGDIGVRTKLHCFNRWIKVLKVRGGGAGGSGERSESASVASALGGEMVMIAQAISLILTRTRTRTARHEEGTLDKGGGYQAQDDR